VGAAANALNAKKAFLLFLSFGAIVLVDKKKVQKTARKELYNEARFQIKNRQPLL